MSSHGWTSMTNEMTDELIRRYGDHTYDYPYLSDFNIRSVIKKHHCKTYEELHEHCSHLNQIVKEIEEMKEKMHE